MRCERISRTASSAVFALLAVLFALPQCSAQFSANAVSPASASSIPQSQLIQPDALNRMLQASGAARPLVLQVGSHVMYQPGAHSRLSLCGPWFAARRIAVARKHGRQSAEEQIHRSLLRMLPMEPLPQCGACLQDAARPGLYQCEGSLPCQQFRRRLGLQRLSR